MDITLKSNKDNIFIENDNSNELFINININQEFYNLTQKFNELSNKINFIKKNINNDDILDSIIININNLKNNINNTISVIDQNVISLGTIKHKSIEIEFI